MVVLQRHINSFTNSLDLACHRRSDMFEILFKYPGVLARHRGGRFADLRKRFLIHCADQRMAHTTLLRIAREVLVIADRIDLTADRQINHMEVEAAAYEWCSCQKRRRRAHSQRWS